MSSSFVKAVIKFIISCCVIWVLFAIMYKFALRREEWILSSTVVMVSIGAARLVARAFFTSEGKMRRLLICEIILIVLLFIILLIVEETLWSEIIFIGGIIFGEVLFICVLENEIQQY